ncbi:MAG: MerR family transcriptional regulator [Blastocatellia bacterium]|nr:MerR family transcriptional regulator [Blastocatellia bacterium]
MGDFIFSKSLKYWENEFVGIISNKYPDGKRTYSINDFAKIVEVKRLLYQESLSISDAQLKLSNFILLHNL